MENRKFLASVRTYRSRGGQFTCSPNQSCEGKTSNDVILKDFDGNVVAVVSLSLNEVPSQVLSKSSSESLKPWDWSTAGMFCYIVATLSLIGGLSGAMISLDRYSNGPGLLVSLGVAASTAPIFAIGSIAHNTKRSATMAQEMAELMLIREDAEVGKPKGPSQADDGEA